MKIADRVERLRTNPLTPLWVCIYADILGYSMLTPFLPQIMLQMGVPIAQTGLYLSIPPLIGFFSNIIWGSLSDRYGRKPIILIQRVGTVLSYVLLAAATNIPMIVISRITAGIFNAVVPISMTMISDLITPEKRGYELSKVGAGWLLGNILGPFIGALVAGSGARGLGLVNAFLIAITVFITLYAVKESLTIRPKKQKERVTEEKKPIISFGLLRKPLPRLLLIQSTFNRIPYFMFVMTTSLFVTVRFQFSIAQIGMFFTALSVVNLIIRVLIFPRTLRKLGDDKTVRLGFALYIIAFTWLIFAGSVWEFAIVNMIMSFATSTGIDVMTGVMGNAVEKNEMGEMLGLNSAVESFAMVIAPIIGSNLLGVDGSAWYGLFGTGMAMIPFLLDFLPLRHAKKEK